MSPCLSHAIASGMLAAALAAALAAPTAAQAVPTTVDFSIASTTGSGAHYAVGTPGAGSFTFDSALMPDGGTGQAGNPVVGLPTIDLDFSWFGASFDLANASIATQRFVDGVLADWSIGGRFAAPVCGLMRYSCLHSAGTTPDFMLSASGGGSLNDGVHAGIGSGYGTLQWSVRAAVPEPSAFALLALVAVAPALAVARTNCSSNSAVQVRSRVARRCAGVTRHEVYRISG